MMEKKLTKKQREANEEIAAMLRRFLSEVQARNRKSK